MTDIRTADIRTADTADLPTVLTTADPAVTVNGVPRAWADTLTVSALVGELLGADAGPAAGPAAPEASCTPTGVAVALDDAIVPRGLWASTPVPAGARVEVVTAVQGG